MIKEYKAPYVVAEIGCNHCGSMELARKLIREAAVFCEIPCVKFQKRNVREVLSTQEFNNPHPVPENSYGTTYGEHRERLEFSLTQHKELIAYCEEQGVAYACSVWDKTSAEEIASLSPAFIKIPSACNTDFEMAAKICSSFDGPIHISLGMTTNTERKALLDFYRERGRLSDLVLYHCTSGYPVEHHDLNLLEISELLKLCGDEVKAIGFSGHHKGISVDIAAYTLGANFIERHFTLDRTLKGTDHAASLEPDGLRRLWRDLNATQHALQFKPKEILDVEVPQRAKLKWDRNQCR